MLLRLVGWLQAWGLLSWRGGKLLLMLHLLVLLHPLELVEGTAHAPEQVLNGVVMLTTRSYPTIILTMQVVVEQTITMPLQRDLNSFVPQSRCGRRRCRCRCLGHRGSVDTSASLVWRDTASWRTSCTRDNILVVVIDYDGWPVGSLGWW